MDRVFGRHSTYSKQNLHDSLKASKEIKSAYCTNRRSHIVWLSRYCGRDAHSADNLNRVSACGVGPLVYAHVRCRPMASARRGLCLISSGARLADIVHAEGWIRGSGLFLRLVACEALAGFKSVFCLLPVASLRAMGSSLLWLR